MAPPKHIYETFIRATPAEVWAAITQPELTAHYFHHTSFTSDLSPGSPHRYVLADGTTAVDGVIEEVEEGERLMMTWHVLYDAAMAEEPPSRVEWLVRPANREATVTRLTVRHFDLGLSPRTSANVALGWVGVIDSLKSFLETGQPLDPIDLPDDQAEAMDAIDRAEHRRLGGKTNGETWELLGSGELDGGRVEELLERAHASAYHWRRATEPGAVERARAAWLLARSHTVAGHRDLALHFAQRCAALTAEATEAADFDRAYAHEALARAHALAGQLDEAARERTAAVAVDIADPDDRSIIEADLADGPWFDLAVTS